VIEIAKKHGNVLINRCKKDAMNIGTKDFQLT